MADYYPYKLKLWDDPALALQAIFGRPEFESETKQTLQGPHNARDLPIWSK